MPTVRSTPSFSFQSWLISCVWLATVLAGTSAAGTVSIAWDPVTHPNLEGYRVYYGPAPDQLNSITEVGLDPATTLTDLADCTTWHVAVKAFDTNELESPVFSNTISGWPRPTLTASDPSSLEQGTGPTALTIHGTNFQPGATIDFANAGVTVEQLTIVNCSQLVATVTVDPDAALGGVEVKVVNPDQVFGASVGLVQVGTDNTAPSLSQIEAATVGSTSALISWETNETSSSQVFYRPEGESVYQLAESGAGPTTDHAVMLQGLAPDTTYRFHVASTDAAGNESVSSPDESFTTLDSSFSYIRFEGEAAVAAAPLQLGIGGDAFQGEWLAVQSGAADGQPWAPSGSASYGFYVPYTASWSVWMRVWAPQGAGSWFEQIDGAGYEALSGSSDGSWQWLEAREYALEAGLHELGIGGAAADARLDRVLITDDPNFTPTEAPGSDVTPPDAVVLASATGSDQSVLLEWSAPEDPGGELSIVIRYRTDGTFPLTHADGLPLIAQSAIPGGSYDYEHSGLDNDTSYRYSIFVVDAWGNVSDAVEIEAVPQADSPPPVENVERTDTE